MNKYEQSLKEITQNPDFIGVNIKDLSDKDLRILRDNNEAYQTMASLVKGIQLNEVEQSGSLFLSPSVQDISEKLDVAKRVQLARFRYTLGKLSEVAKLEIDRRKFEKQNKES